MLSEHSSMQAKPPLFVSVARARVWLSLASQPQRTAKLHFFQAGGGGESELLDRDKLKRSFSLLMANSRLECLVSVPSDDELARHLSVESATGKNDGKAWHDKWASFLKSFVKAQLVGALFFTLLLGVTFSPKHRDAVFLLVLLNCISLVAVRAGPLRYASRSIPAPGCSCGDLHLFRHCGNFYFFNIHRYQGQIVSLPIMLPTLLQFCWPADCTQQIERNYLIEHIDPLLRDKALQYELFFDPSEMRWGIRDFASDRHETSAICMAELARCKKLSLGTNYILILGNK